MNSVAERLAIRLTALTQEAKEVSAALQQALQVEATCRARLLEIRGAMTELEGLTEDGDGEG